VSTRILTLLTRYTRLSPPGKARVWLGLAGLLLVLILLFADKPWEKSSASGHLKISDYVRVWFWWAAAINLVFVGALAATSAWWCQKVRSVPGAFFPKRSGRWFWPLVILAVVTLVVSAWPRLGQSLWHDEANRVKNTLVGSYKERDGAYEFREADWKDTFFYYRMPNHTLQSVLSRASHEVWLAFARPAGFPVSEAALRLPMLIAGALGIAMMAVLLRGLGQPVAGVATAWLLAIHPWYLRYASEARGYALVMALLPVVLLALLRAMETGKLRWWALFALAQVAMVYSYATAVFILVVMNALFPLLILCSTRARLDRPRILTHWFVASFAAGCLFLQLFLPCLPQFLEYLASEKGMGAGNQLNAFWVNNFLSHLLVGYPWTLTQSYETPFRELMPWAIDHPAVMVGIAVMVAGCLVVGIRWSFAAGGFSSVAAAVFLLPAILSFAETKARGSFLFEWYLIFLLPGFVALVVLGACDLARTPTWRPGRWLLALMALSAIPAYGFWTHNARKELTASSLQPYREAVLATRPSLDPRQPGQENILTAAFHAGPLVYDPRVIKVSGPEELAELMRRADRENQALFVNLAFLLDTAQNEPINQRIVSDPRFFVDQGGFRGFHPSLSTRVYRYLPGSVENLDVHHLRSL
jgi:hypothetical protein